MVCLYNSHSTWTNTFESIINYFYISLTGTLFFTKQIKTINCDLFPENTYNIYNYYVE